MFNTVVKNRIQKCFKIMFLFGIPVLYLQRKNMRICNATDILHALDEKSTNFSRLTLLPTYHGHE